MIIYLYGPDSYRRQIKMREIIAEYKKKHSNSTVERFYLSEEWQGFKDFVNAQSLFGEKRLAIAYELGEVEEKEVIETCKLLSKKENVAVLLSEEKKLGREFDFLTKKPVIHQEFADLNRQQFKSFIIKEAKEREMELSNEHMDSLVGLCAGDTWAVVTELDKMALYSCHSRPGSQSGINYSGNLDPGYSPLANSGMTAKSSIFSSILKLQSQDLKYRLTTLEGLLDQEDPAKIFNLTAYSSGRKSKFADYDAAIKSGKLDYELALTDFVVS